MAVDDAYETDKGTALDVAAPGVLANDTDADGGGPLQAVLVTGPAHGTLTLHANGAFRYVPAGSYTGPDSFTYRAADGASQGAPATVAITVKAVAQAPAKFKNVKNAPPSKNTTFKGGSTIPMSWSYEQHAKVVNSSHVEHAVTVAGPLPGGTVRTFTGPAPFKYAAGKWSFDLKTKETNGKAYKPGTYRVTIQPVTPGFEGAVFELRVK